MYKFKNVKYYSIVNRTTFKIKKNQDIMFQKIPVYVAYQLQSLIVIPIAPREFPMHHHTFLVVLIWKYRP